MEINDFSKTDYLLIASELKSSIKKWTNIKKEMVEENELLNAGICDNMINSIKIILNKVQLKLNC